MRAPVVVTSTIIQTNPDAGEPPKLLVIDCDIVKVGRASTQMSGGWEDAAGGRGRGLHGGEEGGITWVTAAKKDSS